MLYILGVSYAFFSIFIIIMIFICIEWLNSWWMMFLPVLGLPHGSPAYCVCISVCVESNKMHLCATSVWVSPSEGCAAACTPGKGCHSEEMGFFEKLQELPFMFTLYIHMNPTDFCRILLSIPSVLSKIPHLSRNVLLHLPRTWLLFPQHLVTNSAH